VPTTSALYDFALLRAWRVQTGQTPTQAAAAIGISQTWLSRLETGNGDRNPSIATLDRAARYYGHDVRELFPPAEAAS
jgi:transcriptional regulator with XRE-family HTH domain